MAETHQEASQENHRLKLSIDVKSIKDQDFTGQLFVKYTALSELGVKPFRSAPTLAVNSTKVEQVFPNAFASYYFEASGKDIAQKLNSTLEVEIWHSDRLKKDVMLGMTKIELNQILNLALRKTRESYARVFDAYVPLDAVDNQRRPQKKIGTLRVLIYLQDMGPISLLKERQEKFGLASVEEEPIQYGAAEYNEAAAREDPINRDHHQLQLNELEHKVVWELETWKKAEEAKTKIILKQREVEFWAQLSEQQKKQDLEKEKHYKKLQANFGLLEGKLRAKAGELQKREQRIVLLEQELQSKISQVSRQLVTKDQEIDQLKKKNREDKQNFAKEKAALQLEVQRLRNQNTKIRIDFEEASKEDEKSPLFLIKTELNNKCMEIRELNREFEQALETKEQYKVYYEKMRNEVSKLKIQLEKKHESTDALKLENELLKSKNKAVEHQLATINSQQQYGQHQYQHNQSIGAGRAEEVPPANEVERLKWERQHLLDSGVYSQNDPLIREFDKLIRDF